MNQQKQLQNYELNIQLENFFLTAKSKYFLKHYTNKFEMKQVVLDKHSAKSTQEETESLNRFIIKEEIEKGVKKKEKRKTYPKNDIKPKQFCGKFCLTFNELQIRT